MTGAAYDKQDFLPLSLNSVMAMQRVCPRIIDRRENTEDDCRVKHRRMPVYRQITYKHTLAYMCSFYNTKCVLDIENMTVIERTSHSEDKRYDS